MRMGEWTGRIVDRARKLHGVAIGTAACVGACVSLLCHVAPASAFRASLTRTTGGVANIETKTLANAGFGIGYAQAEDGICTLADVFLTLSGERSQFYGPTATVEDEDTNVVESDLDSDLYWTSINDTHAIQRLLREPYPQGPSQQAKRLVAGFAAGYDRYLAQIGGSSGIKDPRCAGAAWVRPIKSIDVWRRMYELATLNGATPRAQLITAAEPPASGKIAAASPSGAIARSIAEAESVGVSGSNGLAIGSEDATNGDGLVLANPHFPWTGDERFWESHVNVPGEYDVIGASLWGSPVISIGHNQDVAWTHTVAHKTAVTTWRLELVPGHPTQYLVNGAAVPMTRQRVAVEALEGGTLVPHTHTYYYSRYGPVIASPAWTASTAYALDDPNAGNLRLVDQWLAIGKASSAEGVIEAETAIEGVPWVNTIGADDKGNAFYTEIAVTPNLPVSYLTSACDLNPGHSPKGPFDGSKSECELPTDADSVEPHIFGASSEPRLVRRDYVENSNNSFWLTNPDQPLTGFSPALEQGNEGEFPGYRAQTGIDMVNQRMGTLNGGIPTDGLSVTPGFTVETLQDSWTTYRSLPAERALPGLREMCDSAIENSGGIIDGVSVSGACPVLDAYDGTGKLDSQGGWLFQRWWEDATTENPSEFWVNEWSINNPVYTPNTLNVNLASSRQALADAVSELQARGIPLSASFGQVQYAARGEKIPVPGCSDGDSCFAVLRSEYDSPTSASAHVAGSGSSIVMFTELSPTGPISKALLTYSQSEDITSPFYEDQTIDYSDGDWITLPWTPAQVSEEELAPPETVTSH